MQYEIGAKPKFVKKVSPEKIATQRLHTDNIAKTQMHTKDLAGPSPIHSVVSVPTFLR